MLYRISVTERGLTGIANIFRSRLSKLDDLLGAGTVPLNRSNRTTLDMKRSKLSAGICREALSHSGARWRGGGATPTQVRSSLVKKEERVRVNGARVSDTKSAYYLRFLVNH